MEPKPGVFESTASLAKPIGICVAFDALLVSFFVLVVHRPIYLVAVLIVSGLIMLSACLNVSGQQSEEEEKRE